MKFGLSVAFLLLLVGTVTVKGSDLSADRDPNHEAAVQRLKRGLRIYDLLRGSGTSTVAPTKPTGGNKPEFNLADAFGPGDGIKGFDLADAVGADKDCNSDVIQKLEDVLQLLKVKRGQCSARSH
ncbi:uncharacterized protein ABDE67_022162 isoform 1-T1 [Symphorus nematophorus]